MDQDVLVSDRIEVGARVLRALDKADYSVAAAFWNRFTDPEDWRLVIVPTGFTGGAVKPELLKIGQILRAADPRLGLSDIKVMAEDSRLVEALATFARISGGVTDRVHGSISNGVYIEDAYIYRMAL